MKKSIRKQGKKMQAQAQAQTASAPQFTPNKKHVAALAHSMVEAARHAGDTVRTAMLALKGERPETLEAVKIAIKAECKSWLKDEGRKVNPQSIYNYQSDFMAAANGYIAYAGMSDTKRKAFDKAEKERTGYHALVKFLRDTKRGKRSEVEAPSKVKRIKSGWKNHEKKMVAQAKDILRYAPTDALEALIGWAEEIVKARKQGNIAKLRKAA